MDILLADEQDVPLPTGRLRRLAGLVLEREGLPDHAQVGIFLVDDGRMADLNRRYLGREGPTDVLSLPLENLRPGGGWPDTGGAPLNLGDVFAAPSYVGRRASANGNGLENELGLAVAHGLLHLLGYDHQRTAQARRMENRQRGALSAAGMPGVTA